MALLLRVALKLVKVVNALLFKVVIFSTWTGSGFNINVLIHVHQFLKYDSVFTQVGAVICF